ncbi:MAG TPA: nitroreductase [Steroidobacteraceae bacterium]|nr:nitroreductase [Steroidobacteraceae bacterium]
MDLQTAIDSRRSTREFTSAPVTEDVLRHLIDAAIQAPSAINEQPWVFTVIRDPALLERIARESKIHVLAAPPKDLTGHLQRLATDPHFDVLHHAPALIVISSIDGPWAVENCALAAENLMLAACAAGLGSCWIGFAQRWLETASGKQALGLAAEFRPVAPIIVGHPRIPPPAVPRKRPDIRWL